MLKVATKNLEKVTILSLQGQIVTGETEALSNAVQSLSNTSEVILDLSRVSKVDARGLGVLLELRDLLFKKGIRFELMNLSRPMSMILRMVHLDSVFPVVSKVEIFPSVSPKPRISMAGLKTCA